MYSNSNFQSSNVKSGMWSLCVCVRFLCVWCFVGVCICVCVSSIVSCVACCMFCIPHTHTTYAHTAQQVEILDLENLPWICKNSNMSLLLDFPIRISSGVDNVLPLLLISKRMGLCRQYIHIVLKTELKFKTTLLSKTNMNSKLEYEIKNRFCCQKMSLILKIS